MQKNIFRPLQAKLDLLYLNFKHPFTNKKLYMMDQSKKGYRLGREHKGAFADVGFKDENAIDFEDCEDLYEGPEVEYGSSEDKFTKDESFIDRAVLTDPLKHAISIVDEDNYDEDIEENPDEANLIQLETEVPMSEKDKHHENNESKNEITSTSFSPDKDKGDETDNGFSLLDEEDGQDRLGL